uniref:Uncharacterized protein n=1 Tax=Candidatus Kentrum eta TaxID=2126337 RepID=A0A450UBS1_9GAMM|nr:MAG: hypothetical protein BECKH772A_GA0070896_100169 [Candidatus Kentron sp. H]VFJ92757.1 MAG: hypothetical protein BECKH772B_GA0070898_1003310 [Candidatus Kentron sp. H]VFJ97583.1 MAG: hypothetical protein BECKH772C_GA0070978_100148 [Candidatus Kentron sp. H]
MSHTANIENDVEFLETRIEQLDNHSFSRFREWFIEFDHLRWGRELEADSNAGRLDCLINAALAEHKAGRTRDL